MYIVLSEGMFSQCCIVYAICVDVSSRYTHLIDDDTLVDMPLIMLEVRLIVLTVSTIMSFVPFDVLLHYCV